MSLLPCSKARDAEPFAVKTGSAATGLKSKAEPSPNTRFAPLERTVSIPTTMLDELSNCSEEFTARTA